MSSYEDTVMAIMRANMAKDRAAGYSARVTATAVTLRASGKFSAIEAVAEAQTIADEVDRAVAKRFPSGG